MSGEKVLWWTLDVRRLGDGFVAEVGPPEGELQRVPGLWPSEEEARRAGAKVVVDRLAEAYPEAWEFFDLWVAAMESQRALVAAREGISVIEHADGRLEIIW